MKESNGKNAPAPHPPGVLLPVLVLMGLFAVALAVLKALEPSAHVVTWSWVAYGVGGIVIFFVLSRRRRRNKQDRPGATQNEESPRQQESPISLDEVRHRIQERKREKRK